MPNRLAARYLVDLWRKPRRFAVSLIRPSLHGPFLILINGEVMPQVRLSATSSQLKVTPSTASRTLSAIQ
jgi:hypothetical protein